MSKTSPTLPWASVQQAKPLEQSKSWKLVKQVVVYAPVFNVFCTASLRIFHDESACQGSIFLHFATACTNRSGKSQAPRLNITPERVDLFELCQTEISDKLRSMLLSLGDDVSTVSPVSLSLRLHTPGVILCPSNIEFPSTANYGHNEISAVEMICQSKFLRLYFTGRDFQKTQLDQLKIFLDALRDRKLQAKAFDHARHGLVQKDQRALRPSLDPPPYSGHSASVQAEEIHPPLYSATSESQRVVGKRRRGPLSIPSDDERPKRLLPSHSQSRGSSTEPTTPSTLSPSRSIRPTCFEHPRSPSHIEPAKLTRLIHELDGVSDDLIRELLIRSGRQHLLAKPEKTPSDLPCELEKISPTHVAMIEHRLTQYLDRKIEQRFKNIVDGVVDECRDQVYDECKTNEAEFREQVDDANSEVRNTANDCMGEVKEEAQKYMRELEEKAHQYMNSIEDQGVEAKMCLEESVFNLKSRFDTSAQTTLGRKSGLSHELGTNARRLSI